MKMSPNRPYLFRAFFDWIIDNQCTPHIVVNADYANVQVPVQFVQDGQIVLNISPSAVTQFSLDNNALSFNARFSGQPMQVFVPMGAILAIYARENGEGTVFSQESFEEPQEVPATNIVEEPQPSDKPDKKKGPHLRVIK